MLTKLTSRVFHSLISKNFSKPSLHLVTRPKPSLPSADLYLPVVSFKASHLERPKFQGIVLKKKDIKMSSIKMNYSIQPIRGLYLQDALNILNSVGTKAAKIASDHLAQFYSKVIKNSNTKPDFIVREAWVGRKRGPKKIFYRGRGKVNFKESAVCHLNIRLEAVKLNDTFQLAMEGNAPKPFRERLRGELLVGQPSLEEMQKWSFVVSPKGRRYRRDQLRRLTLKLRDKIHLKYGLNLSKDIVGKELRKDLYKCFLPVEYPERAQALADEFYKRTTLSKQNNPVDRAIALADIDLPERTPVEVFTKESTGDPEMDKVKHYLKDFKPVPKPEENQESIERFTYYMERKSIRTFKNDEQIAEDLAERVANQTDSDVGEEVDGEEGQEE